MRKISQNIPMLIFLITILILLLLPLRLDICFDNHKGYFHICIIWKLLFFDIRLYDRRLLVNKKKKSKRQKKSLHWLFKALKVKRFCLKAFVGTGDAAQTALLAGTLQIAAASSIPFLSRLFMSFDDKPELLVNADFNEKHFDLEISCITQVTLGNIILVCLRQIRNERAKSLKQQRSASYE